MVSQFPSLSETFIAREIAALVDKGLDVRILSLKVSREPVIQPQSAKLIHRLVSPVGALSAIGCVLTSMLRKPRLSLGLLAALVGEFWRRPKMLAKSLVAVSIGFSRLDQLRDFKPQLIHATWASYPATVAWAMSRWLGCPFSFTSRAHDIFIEDHMMQRKLVDASTVITITRHNVRYLTRWMPAVAPVPVNVIHSSLNLVDYPFVRCGRAPRKLLSVGRLVPMKGFDVLLQALALLRDRAEPFSCTIIGEGPERQRLEALRRSLGLDALVELPGAMLQADVTRHLSDSSLMVLPCVVASNGQSDGIPNVLMESMASGLPVISTAISGIPELVEHGVGGLLVQERDARALADAISALLQDHALREAFARAGREKVEREFNVRIEAAKLIEHFRVACHA